MGFYRAGTFWAIEQFGVTPDIIVFGKALTNGLNPLSGVWAREDLISPDVFPPGSTHSTFSSNTLGTAVGLEAVKEHVRAAVGGVGAAKTAASTSSNVKSASAHGSAPPLRTRIEDTPHAAAARTSRGPSPIIQLKAKS